MVLSWKSNNQTKSHFVKKSEIFCCELNFWKRKNLRKHRVYAGFGADSRTRTDDLRITNALLYQLSHISIYSIFHLLWAWIGEQPSVYECAALPTEPYQHNVLRCSTAKIILYFAEKIKRKITTPAQKQNRTSSLTKSPAIWKKRISQQTRAPGCDPNCQIGKYRSALDPARKSRSKPCPPAF